MSALTSKNLRLITITFVVTYAIFGFTDTPNNHHHHHSSSEEDSTNSVDFRHKPTTYHVPAQRQGPTPTPLPPSTEIDETV